jgi:hypothetical protein
LGAIGVVGLKSQAFQAAIFRRNPRLSEQNILNFARLISKAYEIEQNISPGYCIYKNSLTRHVFAST